MKKVNIFIHCVVAIVIAYTPSSLHANERRFGFVYESSVLSPHVRELETWNTYRTHSKYFSRRFDQRFEYEFGVVNNLMSALYFNYTWKLADSSQGALNSGTVASSEASISSEWKYKVMDRTADAIGMALYGEATLGLNEVEFEGKLIFDKQIEKFLVAANFVIEHESEAEVEKGAVLNETSQHYEIAAGIAYAINNNFSLGIEARSIHKRKDNITTLSTLYAGSTLSYSAENWWVVLSLLPELSTSKGTAAYQTESRLLFSFHL